MQYTHDMIVIGAGSAGLGCAGFGATIGLRVALIDKTASSFGGDCLNYGCVPSKALLHVAGLFAQGREAKRFGMRTSGKADFRRVMEYVHGRQEIIRAHETPEYLEREYGTDSIVGTAKMTGPREVVVEGRTLSAPRIVLATGSVPRKLELPGSDQVRQWDNESLFRELGELPEHLLIVGGGPISCELAQAFVRLGSRVTLLVRGDRILAKDPPRMGEILAERLREEGVELRFRTEVGRFADATTAILKEGDGEIAFSHFLAAVGRTVRTEGLGLGAAGVEVRDGRIVTDAYYRTTNPSVYAIGDAYGAEMFSHGAEFHNTQLWNNLLSPFRKKHRLDHFTWVTFTDPEIAQFGLTREQLAERGSDYETHEIPLEEDDRAIAADYRYGHLTLYVSKGFRGGKLLGGCMAAPVAGEMIQELHLLQTLGMKYGKLTNKIYAYPVGSRINQKGARQGASDFLTRPWVSRILRAIYRFRHR